MLLFFILFVPLFVLILLGVHMLVATHLSNPDPAKLSGYECGFSSVSDARQKFQVSFFLVAILFIVFASEVLFLYPLVVSLSHVSFFGFWTAMIFLLLLAISFVYELASGALDYSKFPQTKNSPDSPGLAFGACCLTLPFQTPRAGRPRTTEYKEEKYLF